MREFQEFINEKIAVSCSSAKENIDFVKLCCKNGFKLGRPDYMDRFDKNKLWTVGKIFKDEIFNDNNDKSFLSEYKIVQASEFLQPPTIEIFQSKQTVVCLKKQDGKVVAVGKAKCNPEDTFDFEYGATLAFQRMIGLKPTVEDSSIKTLKNGMRIKKQDVYEVGDRVLMKKKQRLTPEPSHPGEVGVVVKIGFSNCYKISFSGKDTDEYYSDTRIKGKVIS